MTTKDVYTRTRIRNIKRAKLKQKECELQLQKKQGADEKTILQTMKEIQQVKQDIKNLTY
jgi:hypothetical protein